MEKINTHSTIIESLKKHNMQTNLKEALKSADTIKSPLGDVACYSMNFAELASEINVHLEGNKVKFTWREYIQLAQIIWDKIKETSRECAGKEIEVKLPAKLSIVGAAFALIGFKL
jgi:hypothetical protein